MNYCINAVWHCSGAMEAQFALIVAFRSSALLGLVSLFVPSAIRMLNSQKLGSVEFNSYIVLLVLLPSG